MTFFIFSFFLTASIGQGKFVFTNHLLLSFCSDTWKPPTHLTPSVAQEALHTSIPLSVSEPLCTWGLWFSYGGGLPIHTYMSNVIIFPYSSVSCLFDYANSWQILEGRGKFVLPPPGNTVKDVMSLK